MLSRVADNLYWMSRYIERAEGMARMIQVHQSLSLGVCRERPTTRKSFGSLFLNPFVQIEVHLEAELGGVRLAKH